MPRKAKATFSRYMSRALQGAFASAAVDATRASSTGSDGSGAPSDSNGETINSRTSHNLCSKSDETATDSRNLSVKSGASRNLWFKLGHSAVVTLALAGGLMFASTASATRLHPQVGSFGSFQGPSGIAVDPVNGDIYVSSGSDGSVGTGAVQKFGSDLNPANFTALPGNMIDGNDGGSSEADAIPQAGFGFWADRSDVAIDRSGGPADGAIYVADPGNNTISVFNHDGSFDSQIDGTSTPQTTFSGPCGVAVDDDGNLYVGDRWNGVVDVFDSSGNYLTQISGINGPCGIAIDSNGVVYVHSANEGNVVRFTPDATPITSSSDFGTGATIDNSAGATDVSVDASDDHVYLSNGYSGIELSAADVNELLSTYVENGCGCLSAIGSDPASNFIYVAQNGGDNSVVAYGPAVEVSKPSVTIDSPSAVTSDSAHLSGTVDPVGDGELSDTSYHFEYALQADFSGARATPSHQLSGSGAQNVSADLVNLEPNKHYHVRLIAKNAAGQVESGEPDPEFSTDAIPPFSATTSASKLQSSNVQLNGIVNPHNSDTKYWFEWGTGDCTVSACTSVPAGNDAEAGDGNRRVRVSERITGLNPETIYHYRIVAHSDAGTTTGDDETFTTTVIEDDSCDNGEMSGSDVLPDCRAWEMVSPVDKNGQDVSAVTTKTRASVDGDAVQYMSPGGFPEAMGVSAAGSEYMSVRSDDGWTTHGITPPVTSYVLLPPIETPINFLGEFSDDLDTGVFISPNPQSNQGPNVKNVTNLYLRDDLLSPGDGNWDLISDCPACSSPLPGEGSVSQASGIAYAGASSDFSHVLFQSTDNLTGDTNGSDPKLYEWSRNTGAVSNVGILPDSACGSPPCVPDLAIAGSGVNGWDSQGPSISKTKANMMSADGSKAFFTTDLDGSIGTDAAQYGELWVRVDANATLHLNESERSTPDLNGHQKATFGAATKDGSSVFLISPEKLTNDDHDDLNDVYRYDVGASSGHHLTLLSGGSFDQAVSRVVGWSDDGEFLYVISPTERHLPNSNIEEELYVYHGGEMRLISSHWEVHSTGIPGIATPTKEQNTIRVSPDGQHVVFATQLDTLAAQFGVNNNPNPGLPCDNSNPCYFETYVYDYNSDTLTCPSCRTDGEPAASNALFTAARGLTATAQPPIHDNRAISDDGRYVFFSTADPLVAEDSNGKQDAYRYDSKTGDVSLLSSGASSDDSYFVEASADGKDAFFTTRERLVPTDVDDNNDLYDARVAGGLKSQNPDPGTPPCEGDDCQDPTTDPPPTDDPDSVDHTSPGNPTPKDCSARERRAIKLGLKAKRLSKKAKQAAGNRAHQLTKKAKKAKKAARRAKQKANKCRSSQ